MRTVEIIGGPWDGRKVSVADGCGALVLTAVQIEHPVTSEGRYPIQETDTSYAVLPLKRRYSDAAWIVSWPPTVGAF